MKVGLISFLLVFEVFSLRAQSSIVATGGEAYSTKGNAQFSVGQIGYKQVITDEGSLGMGTQQPYKFLVLGVDNKPDISLDMSLFPNPTTDNIILKIPGYDRDKLIYRLMDIKGNVINESMITAEETIINMRNQSSAAFILNVIQKGNTIKSISIIKN